MTFTPKHGHWSQESFSDTSGAIFTNATLQSIVNGYVTLVPQNQSTILYNTVWAPYSGWSVDNGLHTTAVVTGDFNITGGLERANLVAQPSGYQQSYVSAGAWEIYTPYPGTAGSGIYKSALVMRNDVPGSTYWGPYFDESDAISTLEVDVACNYDPYSGLNTLQGFITGQQNTTGLAALTGVVSHGIYLKSITAHEYVEVLPYGIRLLNHPEIALPIDLTTPKRIRIAVDDSDIYLSSEDGRSIVGYGKFNNGPTGTTTILAFGAPPLSGHGFELSGIYGIAGHTYWGNIKLSNGVVALEQNQSSYQHYSTSPVSMYTDVFSPAHAINNYVAATVGFVPFKGGTTTIVAQYSGATGFIDSNASLTIDSNSVSPDSIDLTSVPIYSTPRVNEQDRIIYNPIRFKITQVSTLGNSLSPIIDYIRLYADTNPSYLDLLPNWKPINQSSEITLSIISGDFLTKDPVPTQFTNLLINVPSTVGIFTGALEDQSKNNAVVSTIGTGQIDLGGRFGYQFTNFSYSSGKAQPGSVAETYLGSDTVLNFFPNPFLSAPFTPVQGVSNYVTGATFGDIAQHLAIPTIFTGGAVVQYNKQSILRPERTARENRLLGLLGSQLHTNEYLQNITIPSYGTGTHKGTAGIEIVIPSGIANAKMLAELDLQISQGSGLYVYTSGAATNRNWLIEGSDFRNYRQVGFPITATSSGEIRIGFVVPSGRSLSEETIYNIDNITVSPINTSYLVATGLTFDIHRTGLFLDKTIVSVGSNITRANTVFNTDAYIYNYPETNGIIVSCTGHQLKGFNLYLTPNGYLSGVFNTETDAMASSSAIATGFLQSAGTHTIVSSSKVPLGQTINIGFIHEVYTYNKFAGLSYTGAALPENFAACNRAYLTINGQAVQSIDCMSGWWHNYLVSSVTLDSAPIASFIPLSGTPKVTLFSGIQGSFDGAYITRPPIGDTETELSIKAARASVPYFLPNVFCNGNVSSSVPNVLYSSIATATTLGQDTYIASCYNFYSPGYTNWDHGPIKNHLMFSGNVIKDIIGPYTGFGSTRFYSGATASARYSSSMDRWINSDITNQVTTLYTFDQQNKGIISVKGWVYPRTTGTILSILSDENNFTGESIKLNIGASNLLYISKYSDTNTRQWEYTGQSVNLNQWNWLGMSVVLGDKPTTTWTGLPFAATITPTGFYTNTLSYSGIGYGFRYKGRTGDSTSSAFRFGTDIDMNLCDWSILLPPLSLFPPNPGGSWTSGSKSGRYQALMQDVNLYTGAVSWDSFESATFNLPVTTEPESKMFWVAAHSAYDSIPRLNDGILLHDDKLFKEVEAYNILYDASKLYNKFGDINSPIKIGNSVPDKAINIAKIDSQQFDVLGSINTLDLSFSSLNNLTSYKEGEYTVNRQGGKISPTTGNPITSTNTYTLSGRADVIYSGQLVSDNVDITTYSITHPNLTSPAQGYYCYLLGRGKYITYAPNTNPHNTGTLTTTSTGSLVDTYIANLEIIRNSISLKSNDGSLIDINQYPYDIAISPFDVKGYTTAIQSGLPLRVDGLSLDNSSNNFRLDDNLFSVILILNKKTIANNDSVWAHYNSYDVLTNQINTSHKEIVNPIPIFRKNQEYEQPLLGRYALSKDIYSQNYNITIYGIESGTSGRI